MTICFWNLCFGAAFIYQQIQMISIANFMFSHSDILLYYFYCIAKKPTKSMINSLSILLLHEKTIKHLY